MRIFDVRPQKVFYSSFWLSLILYVKNFKENYKQIFFFAGWGLFFLLNYSDHGFKHNLQAGIFLGVINNFDTKNTDNFFKK